MSTFGRSFWCPAMIFLPKFSEGLSPVRSWPALYVQPPTKIQRSIAYSIIATGHSLNGTYDRSQVFENNMVFVYLKISKIRITLLNRKKRTSALTGESFSLPIYIYILIIRELLYNYTIYRILKFD